ncbi:core-2/I-branching enzyme-domain-containing protein [Hyaloraphidium curvatum]|nr:core-2/I-branching enzyme-domain-containing protein [Hyaloraphidium curvatum]
MASARSAVLRAALLLSACALLGQLAGFPPARGPVDASHSRMALRGIAYPILAENNSLPGLPRLLRAIHHPLNAYAVHVDARAANTSAHAALVEFASRPPYSRNVLLLPPTLTTYAGISTVLARVEATEALLRLFPGWSHCIPLSGSDYPLVGQEDLMAALDGASRDARGKPIDAVFLATWRHTERWRTAALDAAMLGADNGQLAVLRSKWHWIRPPRPVPSGPAQFILPRRVVGAALPSAEFRRMLVAFAGTEAPGETVWQAFFEWTQLGRELGRYIADDSMRYDEPVPEESHTLFLETREQLERALASGAPFARKFRPDATVLDAVDALDVKRREEVRAAVVARMKRAVAKALEKDEARAAGE